jgi:hypothetical protein
VLVRPIPRTPEIEAVAKRVVWFEPPEQAIADPIRFLAYAMTYGDHADMTLIREHISDLDLLHAVTHAPPGVFDDRSWAYWNLVLGRDPAPPLPERVVPEIGFE